MGFWRREKARIHVKNRFMMSRDDTRAWNGFLMKRSVRNTEAAHSDIGERTIGRRTWGRSDRGSLREEFGMLMSSPSPPWGPGPSPPGSPLRVLSLPGTGNVGILTVANYRTHDQLSALVALNQQILTLYSEMPLPINHPTVVILEHYLDVSPTCDEVFSAWKEAAQVR